MDIEATVFVLSTEQNLNSLYFDNYYIVNDSLREIKFNSYTTVPYIILYNKRGINDESKTIKCAEDEGEIMK